MSAWSWLPATITSSRPASARPRSSKKGRAAVHRLAQRPMPQLERVTEQHHAIHVGDRLQQRCAQLGTAQQVRPGDAAEVQVGDDQRAHD